MNSRNPQRKMSRLKLKRVTTEHKEFKARIQELEEVNKKLKEENDFLQKDTLSMFNYTKELLQKIKDLEKEKDETK